jgi:hypothetical protein
MGRPHHAVAGPAYGGVLHRLHASLALRAQRARYFPVHPSVMLIRLLCFTLCDSDHNALPHYRGVVCAA